MAGTHIKVSKRMLFTWCLLSSLILFFLPGSLTSRLQFGFARIFHVPLNFGRTIHLSAQPGRAEQDMVSRSQYNQLQNHLANVTAQLHYVQQQVTELSGLREHLPWEGVSLRLAGIVTTAGQGPTRELVINRGSNAGIRPEQYVIADNSVIGTVCQVSPNSARVRLVTDPASRVAVELGDDRAEGLMRGSGSGAQIGLVPSKVPVERGDAVYASARAGYLPSPMIAGVVRQVQRQRENPLVWDIHVEPACEIERLSDVAVIIIED